MGCKDAVQWMELWSGWLASQGLPDTMQAAIKFRMQPILRQQGYIRIVLGHPSGSWHTDGQCHTVSPAAYAATASQRKDSAVPGQHEEYDWLAWELCVSLACSQACAAELQLKSMYSVHIKHTASQLSGV